jgi:hypothetical protein
MRRIFSDYYDAHDQSLCHPGTQKVLLRMKAPSAVTSKPQPLLCLWAPVCRSDADAAEIFFQVPVSKIGPARKDNGVECASGEFDTLHVFSVSNFLRAKLAQAASPAERVTISLPLPRVSERLRLLAAIFS